MKIQGIVKGNVRNNGKMRWIALLIVSFTMMWGYFLNDAMSPLMDMLGEKPLQCMQACNDNVCGHTTTMYAGTQRQCMQAYNDKVCRHATTLVVER
ncbi:MAG: hypothetical protein LBS54_02250 [Dysgonamonadaceae bacterium]|jgi:hypothetical protein|nr:hypothetical protein [Dysgonamonadaceae bacterium]